MLWQRAMGRDPDAGSNISHFQHITLTAVTQYVSKPQVLQLAPAEQSLNLICVVSVTVLALSTQWRTSRTAVAKQCPRQLAMHTCCLSKL